MREEAGLTSPHAQAVGHSIDVVEPARDQIDLQDRLIGEAETAQPLEVIGLDLVGGFREFHGIVQHGPIGFRDIRLRVVSPQRGDKLLIE